MMESFNQALLTLDQRRERILAAQRYRRAHMRRIDYYVSPEADAIINRLRRHAEGGGCQLDYKHDHR
jgi:hypothetical protein